MEIDRESLPAEDWIIVLEARCLIGVQVGDGASSRLELSPVFVLEGGLSVHGGPNGQVKVERPCRISPLLGFVSLRRLSVPADRPVVRVRDLGRVDRSAIELALALCVDLARNLRASDAGIALVALARPEQQ